MSGFGYNVLGFGANAAGGGADLPSDDEFNRVSFLSHFDGSNDGVNSVFDDASDSNHTITANGDVTQGSFGPFARPDGEWGVTFDGLNDSYLTTPNSSDFAFGTGDFTIEFWFNPNHTDTGYILDSRGININGFYLRRTGTTGDLRFTTANGSSFTNHDIDANTVNNNWYHFCATRASGVIKFFLNGSQVGSDGNDTSNITSTDLNIGASYGENLAYTGIISNLRIIKGTAVNPTGLPTSPATNVTNTVLLTCQSNRFVDNSSSGHTVTPYGGVAVTAFGPFLTSSVYDAAVNGASAYFDGTADALSVASSPISASGNFTLEGWVYSNSASEQAIVGQYQGRSTGRMIVYTSNGKLIFFQNGVTGGNSGSNVTLGQWAHFVLQRTGSNIAFYENGARVLNNSAGNIAQDYLVIGAEDVNSGNYPNTFDGYISNIRITSSAVYSEGTSITVPTAPYSTVTNTNLLLNMSNGQAIDSTAQHNLSLENGTNISTAQAKFGNSSLYFDGTTDTATVIGSENVNFGKANFTVEGWIRPASFSGYKPNIISKWTNGSRGWAVRLVASGSGFVMRFTFSTDGSNDYNLDATTVLAFDTWHYFAFVQNSNTVTCYSNGTANGTISCSTIFASTNPIILGDWDTNQADYNGYIDDIRVTTGVARYTSNFTAPTEPFPDKGQDA